MMKNKRITTTAAFLLAAVMLIGLNAQNPRRGAQGERFQGREFSQKHERSARHVALNLTEDQKEEMKALRVEHYNTMKPLKAKMAELKAREKTLLSEKMVDLKAVNKVIDEQTDLMNTIKKSEVEHRIKARGILTDEQLMKLEQRKNMRMMHQGRMHHKNVG